MKTSFEREPMLDGAQRKQATYPNQAMCLICTRLGYVSQFNVWFPHKLKEKNKQAQLGGSILKQTVMTDMEINYL